MPESILKDLSRDQPLLYGYARGISAGKIPEKLIQQKPGPINHSCWLTLGIRIMIDYTRTEEPGPGLIKIVSYVVQVYVPSWFLIKLKHHFKYGPSNLLRPPRAWMCRRWPSRQSSSMHFLLSLLWWLLAYFHLMIRSEEESCCQDPASKEAATKS